MRLAMTFLVQHDAIKQRRIRAAPMMKIRAGAELATLPLSTPITAYDGVCHDGQSSSTGGSYYHLANDRNHVEAPQSGIRRSRIFAPTTPPTAPATMFWTGSSSKKSHL